MNVGWVPKCTLVSVALLSVLFGERGNAQELTETLPALTNQTAPANFEQMWAGFDPRAEPLETEVIKQWEQDGAVLQVVRFRIGVFKGKISQLAAVYGYPKSIEPGEEIPGLLQIHGGGQYADQKAVIANAKRGYATVSIAWAGRISAKDYSVNADVVKLFWDEKTDDPKYKLTTDWGNVDGYHAPCRNPGNNFPSAKVHPWTLDSIESPRNSPWFLCTMAARRALTFLEQQPQVDPQRLGVYGHSMGGKLTVMTASDERVKAAAPSCGGISDRANDSALFRKTVGDDPSLGQISCPIMFLSPANDFHGRIGDLPRAVTEITSRDWRITCSPHMSHKDTAEYLVNGMLWFDQHLKGDFEFPKTPAVKLNLSPGDGVPELDIRSDMGKKIRSVEVFYTQHGRSVETNADRENTKSRFWNFAKPEPKDDGVWTAKFPVATTDKPVWVYANVEYELPEPVSGAGYYYESYTAKTFKLSSLLKTVSPEELKNANVTPTLGPTSLIEDFEGDWDKEWYPLKPDTWKVATHKVYAPTYAAPAGPNVMLAFRVKASEANKLLIIVDSNIAQVDVKGDRSWEDVSLSLGDFKDFDGAPLKSWAGIKTLGFGDTERLRGKERSQRRIVGKSWKGEAPKFGELKWITAAVNKKADEKTNAANASDNAARLPEPATFSPKADSSILSVFPNSTVGLGGRTGQTKITNQFTPSKSVWMEGLEEPKVFHAEMTHAQDQSNSYTLRVGKGGQVYSLRGPFGESVPPSYRKKGSKQSPWNDEVWQFVAVCTKYNGLDQAQQAGKIPEETIKRIEESEYSDDFFIHNSGAYIPSDIGFNSLYCPLLCQEEDPKGESLRLLNWGLVPQVKTIHRSPILFYTQVRDAGNGVIELTWVVHNFSVDEDIVFDHLNAPWGGTRVSSLPLRYVSDPEGKLLERKDILSKIGVVPVRETAGWNISCAGEDSDSPSLALVYGRDKHLESELANKAAGKPYAQFKESLYRDWRANEPAYENQWKDWATRPANSFRNYDVCEVIPKLQIAPGTSIWYRSFLVVGPKDKVIKQSSDLVDQVDYGLLEITAEASPKVFVCVKPDQVDVGLQKQNLESEFGLFAQPVAGSKPIFLIENSDTNQQVLTTDPYIFVPQEKLDLQFPEEHSFSKYYAGAIGYALDKHHCRWKGLIGFGYENKPASGEWAQLSTLLDRSNFPTATKFHLDLWVEVAN